MIESVNVRGKEKTEILFLLLKVFLHGIVLIFVEHLGHFDGKKRSTQLLNWSAEITLFNVFFT